MQFEWEVDDGYAGKSRPQKTEVPDDEIMECESLDEAIVLVHDSVQEDFNQRVSWHYMGDAEGQIKEIFK